MKNKTLQQLVRTVERWGDEFTPQCACGCGDPVGFSPNGVNRYVNKTHQNWGRSKRENNIRTVKARAAIKKVPVDKFRNAVYTMCSDKNLTLRELANAGGVQAGHLNDLMYSKERKFVREDFCVDFLRRVAGLSSPPSVWQQRQVDAVVKRSDYAFRETSADRMPRTRRSLR